MISFIDKLIRWIGRGISHIEHGPVWIYRLVTPWMLLFLVVSIILALPIAIVGNFLKRCRKETNVW